MAKTEAGLEPRRNGSPCSTSISITSRRSTTRWAMRWATSCSSRLRRGSGARRARPTCWRGWAATNSRCCCGRSSSAVGCRHDRRPHRQVDGAPIHHRRPADRDRRLVGIAMAPQDGVKTDTLMKNADLALYKAKSEGRSTYHFFERGMDAALQKRRSIEAGLRAGAAARRTAPGVTSRCSGSRKTASPASRRCCAGTMRAAPSRRSSSSRSPRKPG